MSQPARVRREGNHWLARSEAHPNQLRRAAEPHDADVDARFTRLTNAFSKKVENHAAAIALYFMYYNFGRIHQTLRVTPAMEAGVANHVWSVEEIVGLLEGR
jgi:hypothetical protein